MSGVILMDLSFVVSYCGRLVSGLWVGEVGPLVLTPMALLNGRYWWWADGGSWSSIDS